MDIFNHRTSEYNENLTPGPSPDREKEGAIVDNKKFFFFKKRGKFVKVNINSVIYIQAEGNYTYTFTEGEKYINTSNLKEMEELFYTPNFMRIHRSFIVNLDKLTSLDLSNNKISLGKYEVPISRSMKNELKQRVNLIK